MKIDVHQVGPGRVMWSAGGYQWLAINSSALVDLGGCR